MNKKVFSNIFPIMAYIYLLTPFLIFAAGWMKFYIAVPVILIVLFTLFKMCRKPEIVSKLQWNISDIKKLAIVVGIVFFWVGISGVGGFSYQSDDHTWRNAIFETLVYEKWPVVTVEDIGGIPTERGFSYYMGFWLPAAMIGKLFGIGAGYFAQVIWAVMGIVLFYCGLCILRQKISVWPLFIFIFFSGMDILGYYVTGIDLGTIAQSDHLEWWTKFQFSSITTQLFWVFNQCIPAWLVTMLLLLQKSNRYVAVLLAAAMLNCTLPFVGLIPFVVYWIFSRKYDNNTAKWKTFMKDTFTIENILGGGTIGVLSFLFLMKPGSGSNITLLDFSNGGWLVYTVFLALEIGGLCIAIYRYHTKNAMFFISIVWLAICPLLNIYGEVNFCMRASIPALLILFLCTLRALEESFRLKQYLQLAVISVIIGIGTVTPLHEMVRSISQTEYKYLSGEGQVRVESEGTDAVMQNNYESCDVENNYFFKYIAKNNKIK